MAFKPHSEDPDAISEINVTPLVDVMLVLVIILLVTAPLLTQSVHVTLPKTAETTADIKQQPLQLGIDATGTITINKNPIADLAALEYTLKAELAKNPEVAVHLYADQAVVYAKVAEVMAVAQHAGITKLAFVTLEQPAK
jgi:biopolymer transport protein ExbD